MIEAIPGGVIRISERGQITIPKPLRDRFGMHHDVEVDITPSADGLLIRKCAAGAVPVHRVSGILNRPGVAAMRIDDVDAYIEDIRGRWSPPSIRTCCWTCTCPPPPGMTSRDRHPGRSGIRDSTGPGRGERRARGGQGTAARERATAGARTWTAT